MVIGVKCVKVALSPLESIPVQTVPASATPLVVQLPLVRGT